MFIECTTPCNQSGVVKTRVRITVQTLYRIDKLLRLHLNLRFWVVGVNISYFNSFGWSLQGKNLFLCSLYKILEYVFHKRLWSCTKYGNGFNIQNVTDNSFSGTTVKKHSLYVWFWTFKFPHKVKNFKLLFLCVYLRTDNLYQW